MAVYGVDNPLYLRKLTGIGSDINGARYYAEEIERIIVPRVTTDRSWVLLNVEGMCEDHSIVFVHNNLQPQTLYSWLKDYEDIILVCGMPDTVRKVQHLGRAVYLPLSVDVAEVESYRREKDRDTCYVGRRSKLRIAPVPEGTDIISGVYRDILLRKLAHYRRAYAVGRCAIEARILGCEVLPFDKRYPDPSVWRVIDSRDAATMLQGLIDGIDG